MIRRLAVLAAVVARAAAQRAPEAGMFRGGPAHLGVYAGGGATLAGLAWRVPTGGDVVSSPAILGGVVYIGSDDGFLYALDLATGERRWRVDVGSPVSSSPALGGGAVYVAARDGFLYAIDAATRQRRWRVDHKISWVNSSPAVSGGVIYVGSSDGRFLQAVGSTGTELWRAATDALVWSSPAVAGDLVYFGDGSGRLHAVDRATGQERGRFAPRDRSTRPRRSPANTSWWVAAMGRCTPCGRRTARSCSGPCSSILRMSGWRGSIAPTLRRGIWPPAGSSRSIRRG